MTPQPSNDEINARPILDPHPGIYHVKILVHLVAYKQHRISDYIMGMLWVANMAGYITKSQGEIFETAFLRGMKPRKAQGQFGNPFLGPDGKVVELYGRLLHGGQDANYVPRSPLKSYNDLVDHENYENWAREVLFAGGTADTPIASVLLRKYNNHTGEVISDHPYYNSPYPPPADKDFGFLGACPAWARGLPISTRSASAPNVSVTPNFDVPPAASAHSSTDPSPANVSVARIVNSQLEYNTSASSRPSSPSSTASPISAKIEISIAGVQYNAYLKLYPVLQGKETSNKPDKSNGRSGEFDGETAAEQLIQRKRGHS